MRPSKLQLLYLICLSMLGFVATDMYLPAFKDLEVAFSTGPQQIALSLSVFLVGMAIGQFLWGLASDRYGSKKTLIAGLAIFSIASVGIAFSESIWQLLSLRFLQAIGVCAPAVIWQAMIIKRYSSSTSQQLFSTIMPLVALSPALAPQLGVLLSHSLGWRSIFLALTLIGIALVIATCFQPGESNTATKSSSVKQDVAFLIKNRVYVGNILMFAFASAAFFAYLTGMPEIMTRLGYSAKDIGFSFIPQTIAFIVGGYLGKIAVRKYGASCTLKNLLAMFVISSVMILVASQWQLTSIWPILAPFCLLALANGAMYPIIVNQALSSAKHCAATAAGLQNSIQITVSSIASAIVATFALHAQSATGSAIFVCMVALLCSYFIATWKARSHNVEGESRPLTNEE
ncbi:purine nucleoside transporter PunC [Vibrio marisflavi]|uniref:Bcr/CflA family efflux transporter n=1 Tax=Vibrio marisflavi CECT 7928 TaxID=634439 RepID=A0ABM9AA82_9VIBR|nr:purine nucleoside transporter PunC [Vibrio marisflavi]CAH0541990.1 Inner membrane transport protein YdhC [Vibrio marisflavi CECT 7928]